jgi:GH24 family phage-related lysozyme (muramidase)
MGSKINVVAKDSSDITLSMLTEAILHQQHAFSNALVEFVKSVENESKRGYNGGKWYPFRFSSTEVDIGYGHRIQQGENFAAGISDATVESLLINDLSDAYNKARRYVNNEYGKEAFDNLDHTRKDMLTEFVYNLGSLNAFPKFVKAIVYNDVAGMKKEYMRSALINGKRVSIGRNQKFYNKFLANYNGGYYIASR